MAGKENDTQCKKSGEMKGFLSLTTKKFYMQAAPSESKIN